MGRHLRSGRQGRGGSPLGPAYGLLLRAAHARARGGLGVQARRRAEAAVPGQPVGVDPRAELQGGRRRGGVPEVPRHLRLLRLVAGRAHGHDQGRGGPQHLRPVRYRRRRADGCLPARRSGARRFPGTAEGRLGATQVPAGRHQVRRIVRGRKGPVGRAGVGRGRRRARPRGRRSGQQVVV